MTNLLMSVSEADSHLLRCKSIVRKLPFFGTTTVQKK